MLDVATFDETMLHLSQPDDAPIEAAASLDVHVGGAERNVAVAARRLGLEAVRLSTLPDTPPGRRSAGAAIRSATPDELATDHVADAHVFLTTGITRRVTPLRSQDAAMGKTNVEDLEWATTERGETRFRRKQLAEAAGGEDIGCSLYELPEGRRSWPYHYHTGNAEALFVLEGEGSLRLDGEVVALTAGDYVALPAGERGAHRVVNDAGGTLRYLMVSTMTDPDVTVYPDSEKIGVFAGSPPGGRGERTVHGYHRRTDAVDYWVDEE